MKKYNKIVLKRKTKKTLSTKIISRALNKPVAGLKGPLYFFHVK